MRTILFLLLSIMSVSISAQSWRYNNRGRVLTDRDRVRITEENNRRVNRQNYENYIRQERANRERQYNYRTNSEQQTNRVSDNVFQKSSEKVVSLVTNGTGHTKEEAVQNALRSAIEQAYGTFVSANTEVLNDDLIKDDIVAVSSGNIRSYKELSVDQANGLYDVSVQATISIDNLTQFAQSRGMQAELSGASFVMNMRMRELNKKNESVAIKNLEEHLKSFDGIFDYEIKTEEPVVDGPSSYKIFVNLFFRENSKTIQFYKKIYDTLESLSLSEVEMHEYKKIGIPYFCYNEQLHKGDGCFVLRNSYLPQIVKGVYSDQLNKPWLMPILMNKTLAFTIYDNLGNQIYCGENDHIYRYGTLILELKDKYDIFINSSKPIKVTGFRDYGLPYEDLSFNPMVASDFVGAQTLKKRLATRYYYVLSFYIYYSEEELSKLEYIKVAPRQPQRCNKENIRIE